MGFNCLKIRGPLRGDSLLFTTKFPEIPGTHFIDLGRMRAELTLGWSHPVVLNTGSLDWESSASLTTRPGETKRADAGRMVVQNLKKGF